MDVMFINPFIQSVVRVLETMVHVKMTMGKPYIKSETSPRADVSGINGFSGDAAGAVAKSFNEVVIGEQLEALSARRHPLPM